MRKQIDLSRISYVIIPTVTIVAVFFLIPLVFFPLWEKIEILNKDIAKGDERFNQLVIKEKQLKETPMTEVRGKLVKVTTALPSNKEIPSLVVGIKRLVQESGMSLEAMQLNVGRTSTTSAKMVISGDSFKFQVTLKGSLEQLQAFLNKSQSAKRVLVVESISSQSGGSADNLLTVTLTLAAPYEALPESMGDVNLPLPEGSAAQDKVFSKVEKLVNYTLPVNPSPTGKQNPFSD